MLGTGAYSLIWVIFIVATFSVIVAVWQEYMNGSQAWRWVPRLPDAIIPFLLGLTEGFLIYGIDFQKPDWWYFSMSIVCVVSFFAYFNMYRASRKLYDKNRYVMELLGEIPRINEIAILVFAAMFFAFGAIESMWNLNSLYLATFSLACIFVWIIRGSISWKRILER